MSSWKTLTARDVMTSPVQCLQRDVDLQQAVRLLTESGYSGAPVVSPHGEPVGVISLFDIGLYLSGLERGPGRLGSFYLRSSYRLEQSEREDDPVVDTRVDDVMTAELITVAPETPLPQVVETMVAQRIHRLLVGSKSELVGIVTTLDVLRAVAGVE